LGLKKRPEDLFWFGEFEEEACWRVGPDDICNLFADFIERTCDDDVWVVSGDLVLDDPPFGALQFTADEVQSVLLEIDVSKGSAPTASFARSLSLLFNRSLSTCVFPDSWKLSYVTPIFKKGRRNNVIYIICNCEAFSVAGL
jgi:hypothetical protein